MVGALEVSCRECGLWAEEMPRVSRGVSGDCGQSRVDE